VPNVVVTESGRVAAIPHRLMAGRVHEFGGFYQARLVRRLRDAGIAAELCPTTKMAKLPGIPDEVCEEFSKRTRDANEAARTAAAERGLDWDTMDPDANVKFLKAGAKASRKYKTDDLSNFKACFGQAAAIGWQHNSVVAPPPPLPADRLRAAYETALPLLEEEFDKEIVVSLSSVRLQVERGLIAHGGTRTSCAKTSGLRGSTRPGSGSSCRCRTPPACCGTCRGSSRTGVKGI
jgi:hypothetical protein